MVKLNDENEHAATELITDKTEHNQSIMTAKHEWQIKDRFSHVKALRIKTPLGDPTSFSMVYSKDPEEGIWHATRPVSDRYQPISTALIVDAVRERLNNADIHSERVRYGTRTSKQEVSLVLNLCTVKINGKPTDAGTMYVEQGEKTGNDDLWNPIVRVKNAYDGTNGAAVMAGWFRMICANGLILPAWEGSSFKATSIHTVHQIPALVNKIGKMVFDASRFRKAMKKLIETPMKDKDIERLQNLLPKNHREHLMNAPHSNAYEVVNLMTYLQAHEVSLARGKVIQPIINSIMKNVKVA